MHVRPALKALRSDASIAISHCPGKAAEASTGPLVRSRWQNPHWVARDSGAPRQIRTAAPASGGRKRGTQLTEIAPAPACLLGSRLTTDALDDPIRASVVAILLPRASDTLLVVIKTSPRGQQVDASWESRQAYGCQANTTAPAV